MTTIENVYQCEETGALQFRFAVPEELQELLGKKVIRRSFASQDTAKVARAAEQYTAEYSELLEKLRADKGKIIDAGIISYTLYCLRDQI